MNTNMNMSMNMTMTMNTNTNVFPGPMSNTNTNNFVNTLWPWQLINEFGEIGHIDEIVKKLKFLTDNAMKLTNLMKLMENKDVELFKFKFLTRNTNDINVFVDHFVNDFNFKVVGSGGGGAP